MGGLFEDFLIVGLAKPATGGPLELKMLYHLQKEKSEEAKAIVEVRARASCPFTKKPALKKSLVCVCAQFCFPDFEDERDAARHDRLTESFTFTLTEEDGSRLFGFCRRLAQPQQLPICLCVLSRRPWFSLFMHMHGILQSNFDLARFVPAFVSAAYAAPVPPPGESTPICVEPLYKGASYFGVFKLSPPVEDRPSGIQFEPLLNALGVPNVLRVLGALLTEQRVVFVGSRWGHVSGCAHAATVMLYPLQWQHILIPVLPKSKLSYACAPMPFVLGVQTSHLPALMKEPLDQVRNTPNTPLPRLCHAPRIPSPLTPSRRAPSRHAHASTPLHSTRAPTNRVCRHPPRPGPLR